MRRCETLPVPVAERTTACCNCGFESRWGHGCLSFVSVVCCLGDIKTYADSETQINIVYSRSNIRVLNVSLTQQFVGLFITIDIWATCFESY